MDRGNHYEAAFEAFLRQRRSPYVAVDEQRKALFSGSKLKSFDFVVYSRGGTNLLVDVKGRKATGERQSLQTWATRRDVDDLLEWERIFGGDFRAIFAFAFEIDPVLAGPPGHFEHRPGSELAAAGRHYLMLGVPLCDYRDHMTRRSEKWDTVSLPADDFRRFAKPVGEYL